MEKIFCGRVLRGFLVVRCGAAMCVGPEDGPAKTVLRCRGDETRGIIRLVRLLSAPVRGGGGV